MIMRTLLAGLLCSMLSLGGQEASAVAQIDYKCGPYTYFIFGNYYSKIFDSKGKELAMFEGESGPTQLIRNTLYLTFKGKRYKCSVKR